MGENLGEGLWSWGERTVRGCRDRGRCAWRKVWMEWDWSEEAGMGRSWHLGLRQSHEHYWLGCQSWEVEKEVLISWDRRSNVRVPHLCQSWGNSIFHFVGINRVVFLGNHWTGAEQAAGDPRGDRLSSQSLFDLSLSVSSLSQGFAGRVFMKLFLSWTCCTLRALLSYRSHSRVANWHNFTLSSKSAQTRHRPLKGGVRLCVWNKKVCAWPNTVCKGQRSDAGCNWIYRCWKKIEEKLSEGRESALQLNSYSILSISLV